MIYYFLVCLHSLMRFFLFFNFPIFQLWSLQSCLFCLEKSLYVFCKAPAVVLSSFSFCLSVRLLASLSNLTDSFAGWGIIVRRLFSFITLKSWQSFLVFKVSAEMSADCLMGVPLNISSCFFLAVFKSLPLSLIFAA